MSLLKKAVTDCFAWLRRSTETVAEKVKEWYCEEPRGYMASKICPVLDEAAECYRKAKKVKLPSSIKALLKSVSGGASAIKEAAGKALSESKLKDAVAQCWKAVKAAGAAVKGMTKEAAAFLSKLYRCAKDGSCVREFVWGLLNKYTKDGDTGSAGLKGKIAVMIELFRRLDRGTLASTRECRWRTSFRASSTARPIRCRPRTTASRRSTSGSASARRSASSTS